MTATGQLFPRRAGLLPTPCHQAIRVDTAGKSRKPPIWHCRRAQKERLDALRRLRDSKYARMPYRLAIRRATMAGCRSFILKAQALSIIAAWPPSYAPHVTPSQLPAA